MVFTIICESAINFTGPVKRRPDCFVVDIWLFIEVDTRDLSITPSSKWASCFSDWVPLWKQQLQQQQQQQKQDKQVDQQTTELAIKETSCHASAEASWKLTAFVVHSWSRRQVQQNHSCLLICLDMCYYPAFSKKQVVKNTLKNTPPVPGSSTKRFGFNFDEEVWGCLLSLERSTPK